MAVAALVGQPDDAERKIVTTADLRLRVDRASTALDQAKEATERAGGYVASEEATSSAHEAKATLKIPPAKVTPTLTELSRLGTVLARSSTSTDVTEQVVDLDGRIKSARTSADRLRAIMGRSGSAAEIATVEAELTKRETDIESLEGRRRTLQNDVDLATVNLSLTETVTATAKVSKNIPGFVPGLRTGWAAFVNTTKVTLTVLGAILPFAVVAGIAALLTRVVRRRLQTRKMLT